MPPASQDRNANPLLLGWVKEWWDVAKERNSKGAPVYKKAYNSLKKCPLTFNHPSELSQLDGFGPKLCTRLTDLLEEHCRENGLPMPKRPSKKKRAQPGDLVGDAADEEDEESRPAKKPRKQRQYVPAYRSGAYALIVALSQQDPDAPVGLSKGDLIEIGQPLCDASFTTPPDPTKFYTAWNSMNTLLKKELVYERGKPMKRYALTEEGWEVARAINQADAVKNGTAVTGPAQGPVRNPVQEEDDDDILEISTSRPQPRRPPPEPDLPPAAIQRQEFANVVSDGVATSSDAAAIPTFKPIRLPPGSFTVELVLDVREVRSKTDRDYMKDELAKKGATPIMRSLELGDALWVAKCKDASLLPKHGTQQDGEIVLDYIVERKRLDDLINSIKDGRFHEQKFRLRRSGVQNVIYLIEEISMDSNVLSKYEEHVASAIATTQVVNGYFVKKTQTMDDTIRYLSRMTALLKKRYEGKTLKVIPTEVLSAQNYIPLLKHLREKDEGSNHYITYPAFASLCSKSDMMTLRDVYLKMLMCTKGVTGEKAIEMQKRWKTPYHFVKAFEEKGAGVDGKRKQLEMVSSNMATLVPRRKIGAALSKNIAEIWGDLA